MDCAYCTDPAVGYDEDGEPVCGMPTCGNPVKPLPAYVEVSGTDDEDDEEVEG